MNYDPLFFTKEGKPDIDMKTICDCKFCKSLSDCKAKCGRASICYNVEVAEDLLYLYRRETSA